MRKEVIRLKNHHLEDEKLIDFIEGKLNDEDFIEVKTHLETCEHCYSSYITWKDLLKGDAALNEFDKEKLWRNIQDELVEKEATQKHHKRSWMYGIWVASCFICIFIGYLFGQQNNSHLTVTEADDKNIEAFINEPVEHYNMIHSEMGETQGVAWYSPQHKQMILYLNDPNHLNHHLDEILIQTENRVIPITPNHLNGGRVQFYIKDQHLQDLMELVVIPKGDILQETYYFEMRP